jgi:hypothetical protein
MVSHVFTIYNDAFAKFITQVIRLKENYPEYWIKISVWTMLLNFHLKHLMIIVWFKEMKYNIRFHMFIHKMVW